MAGAQKVRSWLFESALPFWAEEGLDGRGRGFVERLDLEGRPTDPGFKRMRVQARQIYVFSHATLLGFRDGPRAAERGYRFIVDHGRLDGGGFARNLGRNGEVLDPTLDLYDQAFVLFALAWLHKASGEKEPLKLAEATFETISRRLRRPDGRGFRATDPGGAEGLQNPHMHLLEAALALYDASGQEHWAVEASRLVDLFREALFDAETGTLCERFDAEWRRATPATIEPGHQFEWAWLLARCETVLERDFGQEITALTAFALEHGLSDKGLVFDELDERGRVVTETHRLWPQTEHLKARLVAPESDSAATGRIVDAIFQGYIDPAPAGAWRDRLDAEGRALDDHIPASSLYHLFLAFSELLRVEKEP